MPAQPVGLVGLDGTLHKQAPVLLATGKHLLKQQFTPSPEALG